VFDFLLQVSYPICQTKQEVFLFDLLILENEQQDQYHLQDPQWIITGLGRAKE